MLRCDCASDEETLRMGPTLVLEDRLQSAAMPPEVRPQRRTTGEEGANRRSPPFRLRRAKTIRLYQRHVDGLSPATPPLETPFHLDHSRITVGVQLPGSRTRVARPRRPALRSPDGPIVSQDATPHLASRQATPSPPPPFSLPFLDRLVVVLCCRGRSHDGRPFVCVE